MRLGKSAYFLMLFANFTFFKGLTGIILPASLREDLSNTEVHRSKLCEHKLHEGPPRLQRSFLSSPAGRLRFIIYK
jgi:hypothetical protein